MLRKRKYKEFSELGRTRVNGVNKRMFTISKGIKNDEDFSPKKKKRKIENFLKKYDIEIRFDNDKKFGLNYGLDHIDFKTVFNVEKDGKNTSPTPTERILEENIHNLLRMVSVSKTPLKMEEFAFEGDMADIIIQHVKTNKKILKSFSLNFKPSDVNGGKEEFVKIFGHFGVPKIESLDDIDSEEENEMDVKMISSPLLSMMKELNNEINCGKIINEKDDEVDQKVKKIGIVPIGYSDYQFLIFVKPVYTIEYLHPNGKNGTKQFHYQIKAYMVRKWNFILDLDNTLIQSLEMNKNNNSNMFDVCPKNIGFLSNKNCGNLLHDFKNQTGVHIVTKYKTLYIVDFLQWVSKIFKVLIVTNSVYGYAKNVCKILDPYKEHILRGVNEHNGKWNVILKSRKDLANVVITTKKKSIKAKVKDLQSLKMDVYSTVIYDDQITIWPRNEKNVLPFMDVNNENDMEKFKMNVWKRITFLQMLQTSKNLQLFEYDERKIKGK